MEAKRDYQADWQAFAADCIPTKTKVEPLNVFLQEHAPSNTSSESYRRLLDFGCGNGALSAKMASRGYKHVLGMDINRDAIRVAQQRYADITNLSFQVADISSTEFLQTLINENPDMKFHSMVCQLVISVVGGVLERRQLLQNASQMLVPRGYIFLSASGISDSINEEYAKLYQQDAPLTGEAYTYYSRDSSDTRKILYQTHHFSALELESLLQDAGFVNITIKTVKEQSSRRPDQTAYFHYATAQKPTPKHSGEE